MPRFESENSSVKTSEEPESGKHMADHWNSRASGAGSTLFFGGLALFTLSFVGFLWVSAICLEDGFVWSADFGSGIDRLAAQAFAFACLALALMVLVGAGLSCVGWRLRKAVEGARGASRAGVFHIFDSMLVALGAGAVICLVFLSMGLPALFLPFGIFLGIGMGEELGMGKVLKAFLGVLMVVALLVATHDGVLAFHGGISWARDAVVHLEMVSAFAALLGGLLVLAISHAHGRHGRRALGIACIVASIAWALVSIGLFVYAANGSVQAAGFALTGEGGWLAFPLVPAAFLLVCPPVLLGLYGARLGFGGEGQCASQGSMAECLGEEA